MSRGNGGKVLYRMDEGRRRFPGPVSDLPHRFGTEVNAFVLMGTHDHLLDRCRRADLGETLHWLRTAHAIQCNRAHGR